MILSLALRKAVLAVHLTTSVGWLGAVGAYLPLDATVALSDNPVVVRSAWVAMGIIASWVIAPLALAALVTGIVISVGTRWGLFRHWWVVVSLVLTIAAVVVLLQELSVIARSAAIAAAAATPDVQLLALQPTLPHSVGGLAVLLVIQWLNVFKPEGLTPYGWRRGQEDRGRLRSGGPARTPPAKPE